MVPGFWFLPGHWALMQCKISVCTVSPPRLVPASRGRGCGIVSAPDGAVPMNRGRASLGLAQRAKLCEAERRVVAPYGGRADLGSAPTTSQVKCRKNGQRTATWGRPCGVPGGVRGGTENTTPRRTLTKKGMAGLNYHKMYHNVPLLTSAQHGWRCFLWLAITQQILNYVSGRRTTR